MYGDCSLFVQDSFFLSWNLFLAERRNVMLVIFFTCVTESDRIQICKKKIKIRGSNIFLSCIKTIFFFIKKSFLCVRTVSVLWIRNFLLDPDPELLFQFKIILGLWSSDCSTEGLQCEIENGKYLVDSPFWLFLSRAVDPHSLYTDPDPQFFRIRIQVQV